MLVTALLVYFDWRSLFVLFGSIGFVWSFAWYRWFRDSPAEHKSVSAVEREIIARGLGADAEWHDHGEGGRSPAWCP